MKATNRRDFLGNAAKLAVAASVLPVYSFANDKTSAPTGKTRLALVGTGFRGTYTWGKPVVEGYKDLVEMVALCDINPKRLAAAKTIIGISAKTYTAKDFDLMISETKPDIVIVTTIDCFHEKYIVRAMELGCDVIAEKPIAIDAAQCQRIVDTENRTGKKVLVGFNFRHENLGIEMKKVLLSGELGKIISIDYQECLNTLHGADYFHRWHGKRKYSGTLLLQKASHHFDMVNWLLDAEPVDVQAIGQLAFYGHNNNYRSRNCRNCSFTEKCKFYWDMTKDEVAMNLYGNCENEDNYYRDGCVWDNEIDIYDTSSVQVNYDNGTELTYSMNTFLPFEGQLICLSGEFGRLEVRLNDQQPWAVPAEMEFRLTKDRETTRVWTSKSEAGTHGGADDRIRNMIFRKETPDPLGARAGSRAGILSSLIGIAARQSIETGQKIKIADMINFPNSWKG